LHVRKVWQTQWDQVPFNKLQSIKNTIGDTKLTGIARHRDEVVLHRARIGHTHIDALTRLQILLNRCLVYDCVVLFDCCISADAEIVIYVYGIRFSILDNGLFHLPGALWICN